MSVAAPTHRHSASPSSRTVPSDRVEQCGGLLVAVAAAPCDVACTDEHGLRLAAGRIVIGADRGLGARSEQDGERCAGSERGRGTGVTAPPGRWSYRV